VVPAEIIKAPAFAKNVLLRKAGGHLLICLQQLIEQADVAGFQG
jgi:hypothetical protein